MLALIDVRDAELERSAVADDLLNLSPAIPDREHNVPDALGSEKPQLVKRKGLAENRNERLRDVGSEIPHPRPQAAGKDDDRMRTRWVTCPRHRSSSRDRR